MKYGFVLPSGDARTAADMARIAEQDGWDGFFVWEPVWGNDAWVCLTAAAMVTERIRLGTMLTPISRMRPWKLASETATLDNLSGGRVILAVGLAAQAQAGGGLVGADLPGVHPARGLLLGREEEREGHSVVYLLQRRLAFEHQPRPVGALPHPNGQLAHRRGAGDLET